MEFKVWFLPGEIPSYVLRHQQVFLEERRMLVPRHLSALVHGHADEGFHVYSMISNHQVYPLKTKIHLKSSQSQCPELLSIPEFMEFRHSFLPVNNPHTSQLREGHSEEWMQYIRKYLMIDAHSLPSGRPSQTALVGNSGWIRVELQWAGMWTGLYPSEYTQSRTDESRQLRFSNCFLIELSRFSFADIQNGPETDSLKAH